MELLLSGASRNSSLTVSSSDIPVSVQRHPHVGAHACLALAFLTTLTSVGIAVMSGWQRGGDFAEKIVCIALGVVVVFGAHLLPAFARGQSAVVRVGATALCMSSFVVVLYGQAEFFLFAQQHAGSRRVDTAGQPSLARIPAAPSTNSLTTIAQEEEQVRDAMASIGVHRCDHGCSWLHMRYELLSAKLNTLMTEAGEMKRQQDEHDRQVMLADRAAQIRDSLRDDPVTARLSAVTGVDAAKLNLLLALVCAAVLDLTGSFGWYLAFEPSRASAVVKADSVASLEDSSRDEPASSRPEPVVDTNGVVTETTVDRQAQLVHDVAAGKLRPTVEGIRAHFRCSQKEAIQLRRRFHALREALQLAAQG
jgi:hypothetical protein